MEMRPIWCANARRSRSFSRTNRDVRNHNSDAARHLKMHLSLVIQKKVARIQAAGVNGFVKGSSGKCARPGDNTGETCDEAEAVIRVFCNSDRRTEDDG